MKNVLLLFCLLFSMSSSAQKKEITENAKFLKIQGGFFYEATNYAKYNGFNVLNIGFSQLKEEKIKGIDLQIMRYETIGEDEIISPVTPSFTNSGVFEKFDAEINAFVMLPVLGGFENGLYAGPMLSLSGTYEEFVPDTSNFFPYTEQRLGVGAGFKGEYYLSLTNKVLLTLGTRITLLNFGLSRGRTENPVLPRRQQLNAGFDFNFWDNYYPLMLGLSFKLG